MWAKIGGVWAKIGGVWAKIRGYVQASRVLWRRLQGVLRRRRAVENVANLARHRRGWRGWEGRGGRAGRAWSGMGGGGAGRAGRERGDVQVFRDRRDSGTSPKSCNRFGVKNAR